MSAARDPVSTNGGTPNFKLSVRWLRQKPVWWRWWLRYLRRKVAVCVFGNQFIFSHIRKMCIFCIKNLKNKGHFDGNYGRIMIKSPPNWILKNYNLLTINFLSRQVFSAVPWCSPVFPAVPERALMCFFLSKLWSLPTFRTLPTFPTFLPYLHPLNELCLVLC